MFVAQGGIQISQHDPCKYFGNAEQRTNNLTSIRQNLRGTKLELPLLSIVVSLAEVRRGYFQRGSRKRSDVLSYW
jgi:hypothetical protein